MIYSPSPRTDESIVHKLVFAAKELPPGYRTEFDSSYVRVYGEPLPPDRELRVTVAAPIHMTNEEVRARLLLSMWRTDV